jgi:D-arabinose 1-dehydrogenase-like Zn-dependent alcohol dehydrogenase
MIGYRRDGGYAEFVAVPGVNVFPKPQNLSWQEAAALPLVTVTAWHMLVTRANVQPGEDGVGSCRRQWRGLYRYSDRQVEGARVITTASSDEKLEKALNLVLTRRSTTHAPTGRKK